MLQCSTTTNFTDFSTHNTCYTSGLVHIKAGDTIRLSDAFSERYYILSHGKTFFGLVQVSSQSSVEWCQYYLLVGYYWFQIHKLLSIVCLLALILCTLNELNINLKLIVIEFLYKHHISILRWHVNRTPIIKSACILVLLINIVMSQHIPSRLQDFT